MSEEQRIRIIHLTDDIEKLKGAVRRHLRPDIQMLGDAAHALARGKPAVTADHIDRVADSLRELLALMDK
jgi:predicted nucleic acid-binding protein